MSDFWWTLGVYAVTMFAVWWGWGRDKRRP